MGKQGRLHGKRGCCASASVHTRAADLVNENITPSAVFCKKVDVPVLTWLAKTSGCTRWTTRLTVSLSFTLISFTIATSGLFEKFSDIVLGDFLAQLLGFISRTSSLTTSRPPAISFILPRCPAIVRVCYKVGSIRQIGTKFFIKIRNHQNKREVYHDTNCERSSILQQIY